jgi:hypothetical protein
MHLLYFCIFSGRVTVICLKKVFLNTDFYFVYNIYISEKCRLTQMGKEYIRDLFSLLQLHLLLSGKTLVYNICLQLISYNFSANVANFVPNFVVKFKSSY